MTCEKRDTTCADGTTLGRPETRLWRRHPAQISADCRSRDVNFARCRLRHGKTLAHHLCCHPCQGSRSRGACEGGGWDPWEAFARLWPGSARVLTCSRAASCLGSGGQIWPHPPPYRLEPRTSPACRRLCWRLWGRVPAGGTVCLQWWEKAGFAEVRRLSRHLAPKI